MARAVNRLGARSVATLKAPGRHADGGGLYLQVDHSGAKRWVFVFQWQKKRKEMGLGGIRLVTLAEAREMAFAARKLVSRGINPIVERRTSGEEATTFGDVADSVMASLASGWRNEKHKDQWTTSLTTYAAPLRAKAVNSITTEDVLDVLKPLWTRIPETASRTRGRIERVLDAARAKGLRVGDNPARWKGHLSLLLPKRQKLTRGHHPAMPFNNLAAFMLDLRGRPATSARALEFAILTAARTGEVLGATWSEIDLNQKVWTIPAGRMKAGVEHRVVLSEPAASILADLKAQAVVLGLGSADLVFLGGKEGKPLSNMAMDMLLRRMGSTDATVHGFRSSFRDWAGETTEFPREVVEAALAHTIGNEVERAYRRGDALERRRPLMEDWAKHCARPVPPAS